MFGEVEYRYEDGTVEVVELKTEEEFIQFLKDSGCIVHVSDEKDLENTQDIKFADSV